MKLYQLAFDAISCRMANVTAVVTNLAIDSVYFSRSCISWSIHRLSLLIARVPLKNRTTFNTRIKWWMVYSIFLYN